MKKYIILLILILKINTDIQSIEECLEYFYTNYQTPKSEYLYLYEISSYLTTINNEEYTKIFSSSQSYSKLFYTQSNKISLKNYTYFFLNPNNYDIKIIIQPCKDLKQNCCDNLSQCPTEHTEVIGKKDLEVAYIINNFLPFCTGNFENYCGTFLEIHTPGSEIILQEIQISKTFSSGFQTLFLSTKKLCAGKYEIWMVMRMRGVNYLMVVKPFYVKYPSCTCEEILNHGFSC